MPQSLLINNTKIMDLTVYVSFHTAQALLCGTFGGHQLNVCCTV